MTTRFNDMTWSQNVRHRERTDKACVYCSPSPLAVPLNSLMFVLEMNNTTNKIEGIGLVRNNVRLDLTFEVYEEGDFNRYVFRGDHRLNREELPIDLVLLLENILFVGKSHYKRGRSVMSVGEKFFKKCKELGGDELVHVDEETIELNMKRIIKELFKSKYIEM
jgi:hypothetical protein